MGVVISSVRFILCLDQNTKRVCHKGAVSHFLMVEMCKAPETVMMLYQALNDERCSLSAICLQVVTYTHKHGI